MLEVVSQMAALIACGMAWRTLRPLGMDADRARHTLAAVVFVLLLPALVLLVLWRAPLGTETLRISAVAASGVLVALLLTWSGYRASAVPRPAAGAMVLAASFPNVTYLGLPVLEKALGPWSRSVAIQYDLFACTPLLLTLGILAARRHGSENEKKPTLDTLLRVPSLWAAAAAALLNGLGAPLPRWLEDWLTMLAAAVVPLMLLALGMSLRWDSWRWSAVPLVVPVLIIQLLLMPLLAFQLGPWIGLADDLLTAVVLEAAMPSMVLGMVFCDRYGLDTGLYAMSVSLCTALSMLTLPLWLSVVDPGG
jgi:predicted permease